MDNNILALHLFFNPISWHYGFPIFAKDEVALEGGDPYIVYSMRFLFLGVTITL